MYLTSNKLNGKFKKKEHAQNVCNHGLSRKVAWIRALVHRVTKICSTQQLLQLETLNIKRFTSWKGFPRWICGKLIHTYTAKSIKATPDDSEPEPIISIIWTKLPFIGNKGNCSSLIAFYETAPERFLKVVNHWKTTECNGFTSLDLKDPTPKPYKAQSYINSSVQGVMLPTSGKRTDAYTLGLMSTRSQKKSITM